VIAPVGYAPAGGSWGTGGEILFATRTSRVQAVAAEGGTPRAVTALDAAAGEVAHRWPQFLPDGRHFLYVAEGTSPASSTTYVAALDGSSRVPLLSNIASPAFFAAPHYLLYVKERVLMAQRVDLRTFSLEGAAVAITSNVAFPTLTNGGVVSAARGLLAIWGGRADHRLAWFTRNGERAGTVAAPTALHNPEFSPDQRQLLAQGEGERPGIWVIDLERGAPMNVAPEGLAPIWSPDGDAIVFAASTPNGRHLRVRQVSNRDGVDRVLRVEPGGIVADWSGDGRYLLYSVGGTGGSRDVSVLALEEEDAAPRPYLRSAANEVQSRLSPDGGWVAYASDESGTWEVYVGSFPTAGVKRVISVGGGAEPQWRRDGRELFYVAPDGTMMAVDFPPGEDAGVGRPKPLFRAPLSGDISSYRNRYAVTADGQRFLIDATDRPELPPLEIIVNWTSLLNR
jgi:Tol biopolymer transport system component